MPDPSVALLELNPFKPDLSLKGNRHLDLFETDSESEVVLLLYEDLLIKQKWLIFQVDFTVGPFSHTLHSEKDSAGDIHSGLVRVDSISHTLDHVEAWGFKKEFRLELTLVRL